MTSWKRRDKLPLRVENRFSIQKPRQLSGDPYQWMQAFYLYFICLTCNSSVVKKIKLQKCNKLEFIIQWIWKIIQIVARKLSQLYHVKIFCCFIIAPKNTNFYKVCLFFNDLLVSSSPYWYMNSWLYAFCWMGLFKFTWTKIKLVDLKCSRK